MKIRRAHAVLALALTCVAQAAIAAADAVRDQTNGLADIAAPPGGREAWIARSMRLNGVPMTIKSFLATQNSDEVLAFYERKLRIRSDQQTRRSRDHDWQVLSVLSPDQYVTIRVRAVHAGTEGTITVSPPLSGLRASLHTAFPFPSSARVVNLQQYDDEGTEAEHISLVSQRSVALAARDFETSLAQAGWQLLRSEHTADRQGGHVIEAQKNAALALINIHKAPRGETNVMVIWRKA